MPYLVSSEEGIFNCEMHTKLVDTVGKSEFLCMQTKEYKYLFYANQVGLVCVKTRKPIIKNA